MEPRRGELAPPSPCRGHHGLRLHHVQLAVGVEDALCVMRPERCLDARHQATRPCTPTRYAASVVRSTVE